jgi:hypothetical protein
MKLVHSDSPARQLSGATCCEQTWEQSEIVSHVDLTSIDNIAATLDHATQLSAVPPLEVQVILEDTL